MFEATLGGSAALRFLHGIEDRLNRPEHLLDVLVDEVHDYERDVFATHDHGGWPPLSAKTIQLKGSARVLVDSGDLLEDLTSGSDLMGDEAVVGSTASYAGYLRSGTSRMPARNPVPEPSASVTGEWARTLLDTIVDGH